MIRLNGIETTIKDSNGNFLHEGDIVAETHKEDKIWDGKAIILERPIGRVVVYKDPKLRIFDEIETSSVYNIVELRPGLVKLLNDETPFLGKEGDLVELHLSTYDGRFMFGHEVELVGSIYDIDNYYAGYIKGGRTNV